MPIDSHPIRECPACGKTLTLYFYPRSGPAPGNMVVCPDDECVHSVAAMRRRQQAEFDAWTKAP